MEKTTSTSSLTESLRGAVGGKPPSLPQAASEIQGQMVRHGSTSSFAMAATSSLPKQQETNPQKPLSRRLSFSLPSISNPFKKKQPQVDAYGKFTLEEISPSVSMVVEEYFYLWWWSCNHQDKIKEQILCCCNESFESLKPNVYLIIEQYIQCQFRKYLDSQCNELTQSKLPSTQESSSLKKLVEAEIKKFLAWLKPRCEHLEGCSFWENDVKARIQKLPLITDAKTKSSFSGVSLAMFSSLLDKKIESILEPILCQSMDARIHQLNICSSTEVLCTSDIIKAKATEAFARIKS